MNIAIIIDNIVKNVIVVESVELAAELFPGAICIDTAATPCGRGDVYDPETGEITPSETTEVM
jgi:hypothetical protein